MKRIWLGVGIICGCVVLSACANRGGMKIAGVKGNGAKNNKQIASTYFDVGDGGDGTGGKP